MLNTRQSTGQKGENIAAAHLKKKGYYILERNYRSGRSEIDLICKIEDILVFVEVRTRNSTKYGFPEQTRSDQKIDTILTGAENYIFEKDWNGRIRFDIIAVRIYPSLELEHFTDAFF